MPINVNVAVLVPFLEKLLQYASSGIGSVAGSMLAPWKARQEVKANKILALGKNQVREIHAKGDATVRQLITDAQAEAQRAYELSAVQSPELPMGEDVEQRILYQEKKRQQNIQEVLGKAADAATGAEAPDQEPDHDWTARFFSSVQDVSSEDMQTLWAKVLAGEVERPGSTSTRTLSILRDLDQATARLFRTLCSLASTLSHPDGSFYDSRVIALGGDAGANDLERFGLPYAFLNFLNEHGLVVPGFASTADYGLCTATKIDGVWHWRHPFKYQGRNWGLLPNSERESEEEFEFPVSGVAMTRAGYELSRVIGQESVPAYDEALRGFFADNGLTMTLIPSV